MSQSCDPNELSKAASCFRCLPDPRAAKTLLLCEWANRLGCSPPVVSNLAFTSNDNDCFSFSWVSTRNPLLFFRAYYGTISGGPYNGPESPFIFAASARSGSLCTFFGQGSILPLTAYFVVITAVDAEGCESAFSNQIVGSTNI